MLDAVKKSKSVGSDDFVFIDDASLQTLDLGTYEQFRKAGMTLENWVEDRKRAVDRPENWKSLRGLFPRETGFRS